MERYLPNHEKIRTGSYYYSYRLSPRFLTARRTMAIHYAGTKLLIAVITSLLVITGSFFLCRTFPLESFLFFIGMVGIFTGILWTGQALFRFIRLYLDDPQGKWIKKEHHKLAPGYIGEDSSELFYMDFLSTPDKEYRGILLPDRLTSTEKQMVKGSSFYKRARRYTHSLRYRGFTAKEKQIFLAAISEIIADKFSDGDIGFFHSSNSFYA